jgi:hypothetical protein
MHPFASSVRGVLLQCVCVTFRRNGELRVADGGAVASHVDRVHDGEGAADAKGEAEKESDGRYQVNIHNEWSLQGGLV